MLLQQIKTWTAIRRHSRSSHPRTSDQSIFAAICQLRTRAADTEVSRITCKSASVIGKAMGSLQLRVITANTIGKDVSNRAQATTVDGDHRKSDPQPSGRAKSRPLRKHSNVHALINAMNSNSSSKIAVASCNSRQNMWQPCEAPKYFEIAGQLLPEHQHNPHVMLCCSIHTPNASQRLNVPTWVEERDKDILHAFFQYPLNIVLHSDCPHIAPHIVLTPPDETPDDFYTPWNNRTQPQWSGYLMVPPHDLTAGQLPFHHAHDALDDSFSQDTDAIQPVRNPKAVFCHSQFNTFIDKTANERLILYYVVKALQKHQCKAAFYAASTYAVTFRERYDTPEFVASLERPFRWTDPAEVLLSTAKIMFGVTVIESPSAFTVPHILINSPPPQNPWIPWQNTVNDPQDGHHLVVPCQRVNYVSIDDQENEESMSWTASSAASSRFFFASDYDEDDSENDTDEEAEDDLEVDQSESPPFSRPCSPGPETPTEDSTCMHSFFPSIRRPSFVIDEDDEDERALAFAIVKTAVEEYYHQNSQLRYALPVIEEEDGPDAETFSSIPSMRIYDEDDEDGLPPLDEWYLGPSARTPVVA